MSNHKEKDTTGLASESWICTRIWLDTQSERGGGEPRKGFLWPLVSFLSQQQCPLCAHCLLAFLLPGRRTWLLVTWLQPRAQRLLFLGSNPKSQGRLLIVLVCTRCPPFNQSTASTGRAIYEHGELCCNNVNSRRKRCPQRSR